MQVIVYAQAPEPYTIQELAKDAPRLQQRIHELFYRGVYAFLDSEERRAVGEVQVLAPLQSRADVLEAWSAWGAGTSKLSLPILMLKFTEDLSTAYAFRYVHRYSLEPIDEYLGILRWRAPAWFPGNHPPSPLAALGIPRKIDPDTDELSLRLRNSMWAFILAHELAHLRYRHLGDQNRSSALERRDEQQADAFAVELLSRSEHIPVGIVLWLQASLPYAYNRTNFASDQQFERWMETTATHPVHAARLQNLAQVIDRISVGSLRPSHGRSMRTISQRLLKIADDLADPDMQKYIVRCAMSRTLADLRRLEDRTCDVSEPSNVAGQPLVQ